MFPQRKPTKFHVHFENHSPPDWFIFLLPHLNVNKKKYILQKRYGLEGL
jgi:hypothetical protein